MTQPTQPTSAPAEPAPGIGATPVGEQGSSESTVRDAAKAKAGELKHEAQHAAEQAKEHVRSVAGDQKDRAAEQVGGFAHALRAASDDLNERGQGFAAAYVREAAGGLERASGALRDRNIDQLMEGVEDFARRQPIAFLGGAVVAGFGLARLMKSSADRRRSGAYQGSATDQPAQRPVGTSGGSL